MKRLLVILALLVFAGGSTISGLRAAQGTGRWTVDSILTRMDAAGKSFKSLTADLEHIKYTAVVKDTSTETGRIFVRRDEKMRIEIASPDKRTILRSGDSLYVYSPKINRVEEYDLGKNRSMVDQYVLLGFGTKSENVRKNYDVTLVGEDKLDNKNTLILELTPKSAQIRGQIAKIQMWIDQSSWMPIQQKFFEPAEGDYFLFHYRNVKENLKIDESEFKQDWPKNVSRIKPQK
ncbi:MAG TPA: outer membrane lipoprotein carrier protein LolA [Candidatus Saccharimonadales bacterium]|nr:outer membrane lipoprotein carrier protein LolA [Candidatus Saccharimonadales bacterium]